MSVNPVDLPAFVRAQKRLAKHLQQKPISSSELESAIARAAVTAHRRGHYLISVAPDLTADEAARLLEREYRETQKKMSLEVKQRARWKDWLPLIAGFENDEAQHSGAKTQAFTRYRRVVDGIDFHARTLTGLMTTAPN